METTSPDHVEVERTFEVPHRWSLPDLVGVAAVAGVQPAHTFTHTATYYDTIGLNLLRAKHTLRRRVGGTDDGWHLKKPRPGAARLEVRQPLDGPRSAVPAALRAEVADLIGRQALVPVAVLTTRRTEIGLASADGAVLALLADDTVEARVPQRAQGIEKWRELEVELVNGDEALLDELSERLLASGLTVAASQSKLGRALAEVMNRGAQSDQPEAADVVRRYLAAQVGVLQALEPAVRQDRPDSVHKARVATRRLRSCLRTFRQLLDRTQTEPLRDEVSWLTAALGGPRDAEVLRDHFETVFADLDPQLVLGPAVERLRGMLAAEHDLAHTSLVRHLDSPRYAALMSDLSDLVADPPWTDKAHQDARDVLPSLVARSGKVVTRAGRAVGRASNQQVQDEAIHDVRKRAKAARYAAEVVGGVVGDQAAQVAAAWTDVQEALGTFQDSIVAQEAIDRARQQAHAAGEDTFTYGVLTQREIDEANAIRQQLPMLLKRARRSAQQTQASA